MRERDILPILDRVADEVRAMKRHLRKLEQLHRDMGENEKADGYLLKQLEMEGAKC